MNKVFLIGNVVRDPELKTTSSGVSLCNFTLAVQRKFTSDGQKDTDFLNIVTWRGLADNCYKYLEKGKKAAVTGSVQTRAYDAADGSRKYATEIVAEEVEFL